jgi:signal transduction histidine kinase
MKSGISGNMALKCAAFIGAVISAVLAAFWFLWGVLAPEMGMEMKSSVREIIGVEPDIGGSFLRGGLFALLFIVLFAFLMSSAGHRPGSAGPQPGWAGRVPFDVILASAAAFIVLTVYVSIECAEQAWYIDRPDLLPLSAAAGAALSLAAVLGTCMSFAARVKLGGWYRNTVCFMAVSLAWRIVKAGAGLSWRALKALFSGILKCLRSFATGVRGLVSAVPLVWKGIIVLCALWTVEAVLTFAGRDSYAFIFWILLRAALLAFAVYFLASMRLLERAGRALAAGDLSYHVESAKLAPLLRGHGEDLNSIAAGMNLAVEERLKSERFKTELITNVSHDIKTPLTSIINYSELIARGEGGEEDRREYASVLKRQSEKLKRLLEDLVEASKASTGSLDVAPAPSDACVLIDQLEGEYAERTAAAALELICSAPEGPVRIMADGRRMQRVFDNLMSNAIKYSQPGTRVYVDLTLEGGDAVISFRNTSRARLNVSADVLMERFVRGDESRTTDGSGLGLSIARSLTELQGGSMSLAIDGDLFKAVLRFPLI